MQAFLIAVALFVVSLMLNAFISRLSTERVLGIRLSWVKATGLILFRSFAALVAGLLAGYLVQLGLDQGIQEKGLQILAVVSIGVISYFGYWYMLGKLTNKDVSLWEFTRTIATELLFFVLFLVGCFVVIFVLMYLFPNK